MKKKMMIIGLCFVLLGGFLLIFPRSKGEAITDFLKLYNQFDQETFDFVDAYIHQRGIALSSYKPATKEELDEFFRMGDLIEDKILKYTTDPSIYMSQRIDNCWIFNHEYQILESKIVDIQYEEKDGLWFDYETTIRFKFQDGTIKEVESTGSIRLEKVNLDYYVNSLTEDIPLDEMIRNHAKTVETW